MRIAASRIRSGALTIGESPDLNAALPQSAIAQ
jgi:hypothetical protein